MLPVFFYRYVFYYLTEAYVVDGLMEVSCFCTKFEMHAVLIMVNKQTIPHAIYKLFLFNTFDFYTSRFYFHYDKFTKNITCFQIFESGKIIMGSSDFYI